MKKDICGVNQEVSKRTAVGLDTGIYNVTVRDVIIYSVHSSITFDMGTLLFVYSFCLSFFHFFKKIFLTNCRYGGIDSSAFVDRR